MQVQIRRQGCWNRYESHVGVAANDQVSQERKTASQKVWRGWLTGQVPPEIIRSNDKASGIPIETPVPAESILDAPTDLGFWSPMMEDRAESTWGGRR